MHQKKWSTKNKLFFKTGSVLQRPTTKICIKKNRSLKRLSIDIKVCVYKRPYRAPISLTRACLDELLRVKATFYSTI